MFFAAQDGLTPAGLRGLDQMKYLDDKITDRVRPLTRFERTYALLPMCTDVVRRE